MERAEPVKAMRGRVFTSLSLPCIAEALACLCAKPRAPVVSCLLMAATEEGQTMFALYDVPSARRLTSDGRVLLGRDKAALALQGKKKAKIRRRLQNGNTTEEETIINSQLSINGGSFCGRCGGDGYYAHMQGLLARQMQSRLIRGWPSELVAWGLVD